MNEERDSNVNIDFPDWYSLVETDPTSERILLRQEGLDAICDDISDELIDELVGLAFGLRSTDESLPDEFVEAFQGADATYKLRNHLENSLLAAAAIAILLGTHKALGDLCLLCLLEIHWS